MAKSIRYGGDLQIGDFLIISDNRALTFGWFIGEGINTVQYITISVPAHMKKLYDDSIKNPQNYTYWSKKFVKGLQFSHLRKGYVINSHPLRIAKFPGNPEALFTNAFDLDNYICSKAVLQSMKFPAQ